MARLTDFGKHSNITGSDHVRLWSTKNQASDDLCAPADERQRGASSATAGAAANGSPAKTPGSTWWTNPASTGPSPSRSIASRPAHAEKARSPSNRRWADATKARRGAGRESTSGARSTDTEKAGRNQRATSHSGSAKGSRSGRGRNRCAAINPCAQATNGSWRRRREYWSAVTQSGRQRRRKAVVHE